jgi:hypothetical protein
MARNSKEVSEEDLKMLKRNWGALFTGQIFTKLFSLKPTKNGQIS